MAGLQSYHGYPLGLAQLIESPTTFHLQPMQIDTKNRHYNGSDFRPDLLPAASSAPPNASYRQLQPHRWSSLCVKHHLLFKMTADKIENRHVFWAVAAL